jgi:ribosomal protein S6
MKTYELAYIISPETNSEEVGAFAKSLETFVQSKEGTVVKQTSPVAKTLAYPIQKTASGFVGSIEFQLEPEFLAELKDIVAKDKKVKRHMIVIKYPERAKKQRRTRNKDVDAFIAEPKTEKPEIKEVVIEKATEEQPAPKADDPKADDKKVELKDIEQKLEELLGE